MIEQLQSIAHCQKEWLALATAALWLSYSVFEYWIGKTSKVKSGSGLELLLTGLIKIVGLLSKRSK